VNNITSLPPTISGWRNLKFLSMSDNPLTCLPPEAADMADIRHLNFKNNKIVEMFSEFFSAWTNVR
jgi:Leucine-rich repeat (LRR) protein